MKTMRFVTLFIIIPIFLSGQAKYDYNWILGYPSHGDSVKIFNGTLFDFNKQPVLIQYFDIKIEMNPNTSISDKNGSLLFYSNGCVVANSQHAIMENGTGINEGGIAYKQTCLSDPNYFNGYSVSDQGIISIPYPGTSNKYAIFHLHKPDHDRLNKDLLMTTIDMNKAGGLGAVIDKNNLMYYDTFTDMISAVRHGNGRDWWILLPKHNEGRYFAFLFSPKGISAPIIQDIGTPIKNFSFGVQSAFSPDGTHYANIDYGPKAAVQLFDFDRCTGLLSNARSFVLKKDTVISGGVAFSPSSRFFYAGTGTKLYQYDLNASDIEASRATVGVYDWFGGIDSTKVDIYVLPTTFYQMMLAPNGKIYMSCGNGNRYLHIIHEPDKLGLACNFEQHVRIPTFVAFSIPNFPHFRLFDMPGSICDSLGINGPQPPRDTTKPLVCTPDLQLYPNPAGGYTQMSLPDCVKGVVYLYNVEGRLMYSLPIGPDPGLTRLETADLAPGIYYVRVLTEEGGGYTRVLAVMR
jgi:hypothetical protein